METCTRFSVLLSLVVFLSLCPVVADASVRFHFSRWSSLSRGDTLDEPTWARDHVFVVNATVGTPGQEVSLVLSPSTANTWVPDAGSIFCSGRYPRENDFDEVDGDDELPNHCLWGSFNHSASSTYRNATQHSDFFHAWYPDDSSASGTNGTDVLKVGDVELNGFPVATVSDADQWMGVLGLGSNRSSRTSRYANFPDRLVREGKSNTKAYSMWLDDAGGTSGAVLFGAIDTSKYRGQLTRIGGYARHAMWGTFGVKVYGVNSSTEASAPAIPLDQSLFPFDASISPAEITSNLPHPVASAIWTAAGATFNTTCFRALIRCDAATAPTNGTGSGARFSVRLSGGEGPVIEAQLSDLIVPRAVVGGTLWAYHLEQMPDMCLFGVQNGSRYDRYGQEEASASGHGSYYNIGGSLLRRTYMVFDVENTEVALAPARLSGDSEEPDIVEFSGYGAPAPSATLYCGGARDQGYYAFTGCDPSPTRRPRPQHKWFGPGWADFTPTVLALAIPFGVIGLAGLTVAGVLWRRVLGRAKGSPGGKGIRGPN